MTDLDQPLVPAKNIGESLCLTYRHDFERALGYELISGHLAFEPFMMAVKEDVLNQPKLAEAFQASPRSAISCLLLAAQCKLLPGSKYGLFYLIPRAMSRKQANGSWTKTPEVTPLIGYKGLATMAQRHPRVHSVEAFCVYEGEEFDYLPGEGKIHHRWSPKVDRSDAKMVAAYAKVIITEPTTSHVVNTPITWVMSIDEIHKSRSRSEAWKWAESSGKKDSPWHTDYSAMCRKTALRAILGNGSVPRDMGVGGVLSADAEGDQSRGDVPELPKPSQSTSARQVLGIDPKPVELPMFDFAEEAVHAIRQAKTKADLEALKPRWQEFTGSDAEDIGRSYEIREGEL